MLGLSISFCDAAMGSLGVHEDEIQMRMYVSNLFHRCFAPQSTQPPLVVRVGAIRYTKR